jgi:Uma2 family endonuclease
VTALLDTRRLGDFGIMASLPNYHLTPEEYLAIERKAERKSEYIDGVMYLMSGATLRHNLIVGNIVGELRSHLKTVDCRVCPSDLKVRLSDSSRFFYPDVSVVCGEPLFAGGEKDVVLNPVLVVEALSDGTAAFDRGKKFQSYQQIESLIEYVLVAQDEMVVESFARRPGSWLYTKTQGADASVRLDSVKCEVPLREIYHKAM